MSEEVKMEAKTEASKEVKAKSEESIPKARLDAEVARRHEAEKKLEAMSKATEEATKAALIEQNKFKELYESVSPKAKLADEMSASVEAYLAEETDGLSDEHKSLIPEGPAHSRLAWVKKAKKSGLFGSEQKSPDKTFSQKPKVGLQPDKWFLELTTEDERFSTLTGPQYQEWKKHNRPLDVNGSVRGGF